MHGCGAPARYCGTRIHVCGRRIGPWGTAIDTRGTGLDPSGTAVGSSGTAVDARSMESGPVGTTFSSIESDEGLNGTAIHISGRVVGTR